MILLWGFSGALCFLLAFLPLTLRFRCTVRVPGFSEAEIETLGVALSFWRAHPLTHEGLPGARPQEGLPPARSPQPIPRVVHAPQALEALVRRLQSAEVKKLRLRARGGTGDAAGTALLYGAAWTAVGGFLTASQIRPELVRLEPVMDGPAQGTLDGSCAVDVRVFTLLRSGAAALSVLLGAR